MQFRRFCAALSALGALALLLTMGLAVTIDPVQYHLDQPSEKTRGPLTYIVITPTDLSMTVNSSKQFTATGYDDGWAVVACDPVWTSTIGTFSPSSGTTVTFTAQKTVASGKINATDGSIKGEANITLIMDMDNLVRMEIDPGQADIEAGKSKTFHAYAFDKYNNEVAVTPTWSSTVGDMEGNILVADSKVKTGSVDADLVLPPLKAKSLINIIPTDMEEVIISPGERDFYVNETIIFQATGVDKFDNKFQVIPEWNITIGEVIDQYDNFTIVQMNTCLSRGYVNVSVGPEYSDSIFVDLKPGVIDHIVISADNMAPSPGETVLFQAQGFDQFDNPCPLDSVEWSADGFVMGSDLGHIATLRSPDTAGKYAVRASFGDVTGQIELTVNPGGLNRIELMPQTLVIQAGSNKTFTAQGYDNYDNKVDTNFSFSSDVGTFKGSTFFAGTKAGTGTIYCYSGSIYQSVQVTVVHAALDRINITPSSTIVDYGSILTLSASGFDRYHNPVYINPVWKSDIGGDLDPGVGTVVNFTATTEINEGMLTAEYKGVQGRSQIKVVNNQKEVLSIIGKIPDQHAYEDDQFWYLNLRPYESVPTESWKWYIDGENKSLYTVSGENSTKDRLIFTPLKDTFGSDRVTIWLWNDLGEIDSQQIWVNITPVNDPPIINNPPDIRMSISQPYLFDYTPYILDIDNDVSEFSINAEFVTPHKEKVSFQIKDLVVIYSFNSSYLDTSVLVSLEVSDGGSMVFEQIKIFISANRPPKKSPTAGDLPNVFLREDEKKEPFSLAKNFIDDDGDTITISHSDSHVKVTLSSSNAVTMEADTEWSGTEAIVFRATDKNGAFCEDWVYVTVEPIDDRPEIKTLPELVVHYEEPYFFNLDPYITDVDTPKTFLSVSTDNEYVSIMNETNLVLVVSFPEEYDGRSESVRVSIDDGEKNVFGQLSIKITDNYIPELVFDEGIPDQVFKEDETKPKLFNLKSYFDDQDGGEGGLSFEFQTENININSGLDGWVTLSATKDWFGSEDILIRALDRKNAFVETTVTVVVEPVDDPPTIDNIPSLVMKNGTAMLPLGDYNIADIDDDLESLEIRVESKNKDLLVFVNGLDIFLIMDAKVEESFTTEIIINISDGQKSTEQTVSVNVRTSKVSNPEKSNIGVLSMFLVILVIFVIIVLLAYLFYYQGINTVEEIYLVYKDGRLIFHKTKPGLQQKDEDIVTSMLTAIQEFVEETFSNGNGDDEEVMAIKKMELGGKKILIERGKNVYIAIILKGIPGIKLERQMASAIKGIENEYEKPLQKWNGVSSNLDGIYKYLNVFLKDRRQKKYQSELDFHDMLR